MIESLMLWLLLPLGIAFGLGLGRNVRHGGSDEMLSGLAHLASENPDRAIAALTKAVERDPAAAELNLTLGALFRKRGEIDRALRLHESVLTQANLKSDLRAQALYELGQDCLKAGLLDRAETVLRQAAEYPAYVTPALEQLLQLNEQLSDWQQALETAARLESLKGQSYAGVRAHYSCELALMAEQDGELPKALQLASRGLEIDPQCVRASLMIGRLNEQTQNWPAALTAYLQVPKQDARFLSEALPAIERVCSTSGAQETFSGFLDHVEAQHALDSSVWLARAHLLPSADAQAAYLADKLSLRPSWRGLVEFLSLPVVREAGVLSRPVNAFRIALTQQLKRRSPYLCAHCGFTPSLLFWRCPSCKQWGSVHPAEDTL